MLTMNSNKQRKLLQLVVLGEKVINSVSRRSPLQFLTVEVLLFDFIDADTLLDCVTG